MKNKKYTVEKNDKYIAILDEGKSIGNTYHVCALLNAQYEEIQRLSKENCHLDARVMDLQEQIKRLRE